MTQKKKVFVTCFQNWIGHFYCINCSKLFASG